MAPAAALVAAALLAAPSAPPPGTYHVTLSTAELRRAGASPREAAWVAGSWTLVIRKSGWTLRQRGGAFGNAVDRGVFAVDDAALVTLTTTHVDGFDHGEDVGTYAFAGTASGLRFGVVVRPRNHDLAAVLTAKPWRR